MNKKIAYFRFYAELNDFLPIEKHKQNIHYSFWGSPTVKDCIEALGVPHTEVHLILVGSTPVDFSYYIEAEDQISVYPIFELLDISEISPIKPKLLPVMAFILDTHLGKLTRYLRMLGFDSLYGNYLTDQEIIDRSFTDNRVILTRDIGILKHKSMVHGYYLRSNLPGEQIREVIDRFKLTNSLKPFTRCMVCNGLLQLVDKQMVIEQLLPQTRRDFTEFYRCTKCGKIYWKGSHYERMLKMVDNLRDKQE